MTLKEMRDRQARIVAEARERLDQINASTDEARTKELEAQHDKAMAEYDRLDVQIKREEQLATLEQRGEELRARQRPIPGDTAAPAIDRPAALDYRSVFHRMLAVGGNVSELSSEERDVLRGGIVRDKDVEKRMQTAGSTTGGGYTVPTELAGFIDRAMKAWGPMYDEAICTQIVTTAGNPFKIPTIDDTSKVAGAHTEGTALTDDGSEDATFGQASLDAFMADTEWVKWSYELSQDSAFNIETLLGDLLGERLGRKANAWLTTGTGSSQPNGIVTAASSGKTAASATAIASDELIDLEHSVNQAYRRSPKARWMFADSTLKAIRKLKDGQGNYLWQLGDVRGGAPATLLNYPYSVNDDMAAIATGAKTVLFGDFGKYYVRKVGSPVIGVVRERFWPDLGIAGLIRLDGEIGQSGAIKYLVQA